MTRVPFATRVSSCNALEDSTANDGSLSVHFLFLGRSGGYILSDLRISILKEGTTSPWKSFYTHMPADKTRLD